MRFVLVLSIAGLALVAGSFIEKAKAEQAFLCEGGKIVYARGLAELERLKASDPCIAGYFGNAQLRRAAPAEAPPTSPAKTSAAEATADAIPVASTPKIRAESVAPQAPAPLRILNVRPGSDTWTASSR